MFRHRKRLICKRLIHLMRLKKIKTEFILQRQLEEMEAENSGEQDYIALNQIGNLSPEERKRLRKENKHLPPYLFMIPDEKERFFEKKGQAYIRKLDQLPPKEGKTKKIVKFQNSFEVKPFNKQQPVARIRKTPCFNDNYHPQHFSK